MIKRILSYLLHHANRTQRSKEFYSIKDRLLKRYEKFERYDLQFIPGKSCYTCDGTGIYKGWNPRYGGYYEDWCWSCGGSGLYYLHQYIILRRIKFGAYVFHTPICRHRTTKILKLKPDIEGYVKHTYSRFGETAAIILFLFFSPTEILKTDIGFGFYCSWWRPHTYAGNLIYFLRHLKREFARL